MRQRQKRALTPHTRLRVASRVALRKITTRGDREGVCGSWDTPIHHVGLLSTIHTPPHLLLFCTSIYVFSSSTGRYFPGRPFLSLLPRFRFVERAILSAALFALFVPHCLFLPLSARLSWPDPRISNCIPVVGAVVALCRRLARGRKR